MPVPYTAVIFDLDGVICHTDHYHYIAWKALADELEIPFNHEINNRLRGVSRMASLDIILESHPHPLSKDAKNKMAEKKNQLYKEHLQHMTPKDLSPLVKSTLDALRNNGILLGIGSSSKNAGYILQQIGLGGYFDAVADGTHITRTKPDPQVFLLAAEKLATPPEKCLVVEDAVAGVDAAIAAGMNCAAIGDASSYPAATYKLTAFEDLISICGLKDSPLFTNKNQ